MTWKTKQGVINYNKKSETILPPNFSFCTINDLNSILPFIIKNYNTDKLCRLNYTYDHLEWYFKNSEYDFLCLKYYDEIIGCVSGKVENIFLNNKEEKIFEINFLCVEFSYRKKHFLDYLISEIGRLAILKNIYSAIYISTDKHLTPLCKIQYYQFEVNPSNIYKFNSENNPYNIIVDENISNDILYNLNEKYKKYKISKVFKNTSFFNSKVIKTFTIYLNSKLVGFVSYYLLDVYLTKENIDIKRAYILYYWNSEDIDIADIFKYTFKMLKVDYIITNDIMDMSSIELRTKLNMVDISFNCYYYLYNNTLELSPKDIGIFIP